MHRLVAASGLAFAVVGDTAATCIAGPTSPVLQGRYLYSDYRPGFVRSFIFLGGGVVDARAWPELSPGALVTSFAEDGRGELYVMPQGGNLYRIVAE